MTQRLLSILLAAVIGFGLTACYQIPVEQGNNLSKMNLAGVRPGMTESQVIGLLGRPVLDTIFVTNELVYVYSMKAARQPFHCERFFVYFLNGHVTHTEMH